MNFLFSFLIAVFTGAAAGYVGSLMISKRMALAGGALGHLTLPGITLALIYGFDVSVGAGIFLLFGIVLIWLLEEKTHLPMEALTAVVFSSSVSIAFLFLGKEQLVPALIGSVEKIGVFPVIVTAVVSLSVIFLAKKLYRRLVLINISRDIATSLGIHVKRMNILYLLVVAVVVAMGVRVVGGLMTAAIVAIPAATSRLLTRNLSSYSLASGVLGGLGCAGGVLLSFFTGIAAGPSIIIVNASLFSLSLIFQKR